MRHYRMKNPTTAPWTVAPVVAEPTVLVPQGDQSTFFASRLGTCGVTASYYDSNVSVNMTGLAIVNVIA